MLLKAGNRLRNWRKILFLIFFVFMTACAPKFDQLFRSSCPAPCWHGVTPGITTKSELIQLIPNLPYYREEKSNWRDENNNYSLNVPKSPSGNFSMDIDDRWTSVSIYYEDDVVTDIGFYSGIDIFQGHINLGLELNDIINLFGEPNFIFVSNGCGGDTICRNLNLIYSEKSILVAVESSDFPENYRVISTLPVVGMVYFRPLTDFKDSLTLLPNISSAQCDLIPYLHDWQGFKTINFENTFNGCQ